jgi:hypothetical protein
VVGKDVSGFFEVHFSSQFSAKTLRSYLNASGRWRGAADGDRSARRDTNHMETELEEDAGDHFGGEFCSVAAHFLRHRRVVLDRGIHNYGEGLVADAAHDNFSIVVFFGVLAAGDRLVPGGSKRSALWRALRQVGGELPGDVGEKRDGDAELSIRRTMMASEFADSGALLVELNAEGYVAAQDTVSGGFIEPGTLGLSVTEGGSKHPEAQQNCV